MVIKGHNNQLQERNWFYLMSKTEVGNPIDNEPFTVVFATNALPLKGGVVLLPGQKQTQTVAALPVV